MEIKKAPRTLRTHLTFVYNYVEFMGMKMNQ